MSLKHALYSAVSRAGRALAPGAPRPGLRVLVYHSVGGTLASDPYGTAIDPARFRSHLDALEALRGAWVPAAFAPPTGARHEFALTFDDGYRDTLSRAAPLLAARGWPFTVFVTPDLIDGGELYLSKRELRELAAHPGAQIGAHGNRHVPLTRLDDAALASELAASRARLEDWLGSPVTLMSYPHGAVDRRVRRAAQAAGFTLAGCSRYGLNEPGRDPLLLCRTEIVAWDDEEDLRLKTAGHWDWFRWRRPDPAAKIS